MQLLDLATQQALGHLKRADECLEVARTVNAAKGEESRLLRSMTDEYRELDGLRATAEGRGLDSAAPKVAAVSEALARTWNAAPHPGGFYVPVTTRALVTTTPAGAGYLVPTTLQLFVDAYREASLLAALRVPVLSSKANASGATIKTATTAYWLTDETTQVTEAEPVIGTISTAPKTVGAYTEASRQFVLQAGHEGLGLVYRELAGSLAEAADTALLGGTAANGQPRGLANVSGIGSKSGAAFSLSIAASMLGAIESAKGIRDRSRVAWVMPPAVAELLRKREAATGSGLLIADGRMLGFPVYVTASAPATWIALGDWSGVTVVEYAPLELATNPYAASAAAYQAGIFGIRALLTLDFAFTKAASFCVATSVS